MDFLRKSHIVFKVVDASDEIKAEAETFATTSITFCEDTKDLCVRPQQKEAKHLE